MIGLCHICGIPTPAVMSWYRRDDESDELLPGQEFLCRYCRDDAISTARESGDWKKSIEYLVGYDEELSND